MLSSFTNCFRTVARHAPPVRTALPTTASRLRWFSGSAVFRNDPTGGLLKVMADTVEMASSDAQRGECLVPLLARQVALCDCIPITHSCFTRVR